MKTIKQSKHLKEMSDKLNKIQRQIMRENNVISKDKTSEIGDLNRLLSRASQWSMNTRKNKAYLNQIELQVSSIHNAGVEMLQKKNKNKILLQQLKQTQMEI